MQVSIYAGLLHTLVILSENQCLLDRKNSSGARLAYQLSSFLLYVYLYAKLLYMPATDSILSISLNVNNLVQSFILACYMPVLYTNSSISSSMT
jgi:hypothetical protein